MESSSGAIEAFESALQELHRDFQQFPFHYGNENPVMPELYRRLRGQLTPETIPLTYRRDHSDMDQWRNREMFNRIERDPLEIPRVRPEVTFYHEGIWGGAKSDFDLVVFPPDEHVVMQGKKQGVGNFVDADTRLSILCEIKHSMNMSGQFRNGGEKDIQALDEYPGEVDRRYFLFFDWWPRDGYGNRTFEKDVRQLENRLGTVETRVDIAYLPREGELQFVRGVA